MQTRKTTRFKVYHNSKGNGYEQLNILFRSRETAQNEINRRHLTGAHIIVIRPDDK
jgi:hypothetical protein